MPKTYHQFSKQLNELSLIPTGLAGVSLGNIAKAAVRGVGRAGWEATKIVGSAAAKGIGIDTGVLGGIAQRGLQSSKERIELQRKHDSEVFECPRQVSVANRATNSARNYVTSIEKKMSDPSLSPDEKTSLESALQDAKDSVQAAEDYEKDIKDKCKVLTKNKSAMAAKRGVQRFERGRADQAREQVRQQDDRAKQQKKCDDCIQKQLKNVGISDPLSATDIDKEVAREKCKKECNSKP